MLDIQNVLGYRMDGRPKRFGPPMSRITLKKISIETGYSITTVSRALAGYPAVSAHTRNIVEQAAERLGYYPSATARQLQSQRASTVGIILPTADPSFADPYFNLILSGIGDGLSGYALDLLISTQSSDQDEIEGYRRLVEGGRVDGLIVVRTTKHDARIAYLARKSFPFVAFGRTDLNEEYVYIDEDGESGTQALAQHLISLGHRRIAYSAAPLDLMFADLRYRGYCRAMQEAGLPVNQVYVQVGDLTEQSGFVAARKLLKVKPPPSAIIAANDLMAIGVMRVAQENNLKIGTHLSIAGFDDIPSAEVLLLTTLRQPIYQIGKRLSQMLVGLLEGETLRERQVLMKPELMIRSSVGPPSS